MHELKQRLPKLKLSDQHVWMFVDVYNGATIYPIVQPITNYDELVIALFNNVCSIIKLLFSYTTHYTVN